MIDKLSIRQLGGSSNSWRCVAFKGGTTRPPHGSGQNTYTCVFRKTVVDLSSSLRRG
jgi:hypothetical protein